MMGQSWMGSDFSNKDVSRAGDTVDQYTYTLLETGVIMVLYLSETMIKRNSG
ncbi:MAG: hypothetical protein HKP12_10515 [Gammaproteobacteria bacterium]|nr:outer membrane lipoprotein-sorting protein [Gammaproteobacteria bacterium]NNJ97579.1 hypothetical protein [Gammaproteobacteria bacterium]